MSNKITVFNVDDHPVMRETLAGIINAQPDMHLIAQASSGREAIEGFCQQRADVTLMDIRLPDISGIEAMRAIRAQFPDARFIILTTFEDDNEIRRASTEGAQAYLLKSRPPRELVDAIREVHAGKRKSPGSIAAQYDTISEEAIRNELSRILESSMFVQSDRLGRFLRFTVETTLAGDGQRLKEYLIGTEVYDRPPSYHPSEDSIVRSEARRLRSKLKEYYDSVGKDDSVFIYYRPGSYMPVFRARRSHGPNGTVTDAAPGGLFTGVRGIRIAVLPFLDASHSALSGVCAELITDELIHELVRTDGLCVTAASSVAPLVAQALDVPSLARKLNVQIVFEGTVHEDNNLLRITSRVVNAADGFQIWSERLETEPDPQKLFKVSERIASALISRIRTGGWK
ncbi:response regulator [Edaphobacter aggregans]|uniref:response regulator n=1 Tax=Edaphobacter aggregans TaxID=570835 RepID=UPI00068FB23E|nr:response regulator [Edaphobacter aggregans]